MKVLFCTPEVYPFSKIGGVADFSESLPKALEKLNNTIYVVSPYYQTVHNNFGTEMEFLGERKIELGNELHTATYYRTFKDDIFYFFIGNEFFDRKYFFNHHDDIKRFMFLNLATLELVDLIKFSPDIIHLNDWSTSLIPYFINTVYSGCENLAKAKILLTIHNLEKQGSFSKDNEYLFKNKNFTYLHQDKINFLKTGIMRANKVNTVSKSYRSEMLTKFFGFSLDGALKSRQYDLLGIQNGLDFETYNPKTDKEIYFNYDQSNYIEGKLKNKQAFLKEFGLKDENKMLISYIGRFAKEKGVGLISEVIEKLLDKDQFNFVVIGEGDVQFEMFCEELENKYPKNFKYFNKHNYNTSQKAYAASDLLLMPSLYEASGLNQMIAMRYGTLPLVRETGGLKDTVISYLEDSENGTGFKFENFDDEEFYEAIKAAISYYQNDKAVWNNIIKNAMAIDNNIDKMAKEYHNLYKEMVLED